MRKRNKKTTNRRDATSPVLPIAEPVTITKIAGGVNLNVPAGLILNPVDPSEPLTDFSLDNTAGHFANALLIARQVDQFNVTVKADGLGLGTFSGTVSLGPNLAGLRSARGGTLVIPALVLP